MAKKPKQASVKVHLVPILDVMPNPENPRKITEEKIQELCRSMKELPEMINYRFLVVDRDTGFILGGNQRWQAARRLGIDQVPVAYSDEMTEEQKREFIIRDNIEAGEWDEDSLSTEFRDFPLVNWGLVEPATAAERAVDQSEVEAAKFTYDNAEVKQIVVYFEADQHEKIVQELDLIKSENFLGDNSEALLLLLETSENEN